MIEGRSKVVKLPKELRPVECESLIRLGNLSDGGYVVDQYSITSADYILSFGLNDDWSFENDIFLKFKKLSFVYDASVNNMFFLKRALKSSLSFRFTHFLTTLKKIINYNVFFRKHTHVQKFIGPFDDQSYILPHDIFDGMSNKSIFLKIDIEGDEYFILDWILETQGQIRGLVIEFHDVALHMPKILSFFEKFDHTIVNININNYGKLTKSGEASIIEVTTTCQPRKMSKGQNIQDLNQLNNPDSWTYSIDYV